MEEDREKIIKGLMYRIEAEYSKYKDTEGVNWVYEAADKIARMYVISTKPNVVSQAFCKDKLGIEGVIRVDSDKNK